MINKKELKNISKGSLLNTILIKEEEIKRHSKEIHRLKHIVSLLASEIDLSNEVFDALSAEDDYDWIASYAIRNN